MLNTIQAAIYRAYAAIVAQDTGHGPFQSNGMCLLEFVVHWNL